MQQRTCTIGLDLGTTTIKAIAFEPFGREIARAEATIALAHDEAGAAEQDPPAVYAAVMQTLGACGQLALQRGYAVAHIGVSAAMHSLIPLGPGGVPLMRALTWMDTRAKDEARALWQSPEGKAIYARTGTPIHAMAPLSKLLWLRHQHPEVFAGAERFVSLKEWIWHQWFGEWVVDASIASATGLYNLREGTWDAGALALAGITAERLSRLVPTTYTHPGAGDLTLARAGVTPATSFNVGASDGVLANLGVGAIGEDLMVLTIGTSCAVRMGSAVPFTDAATRSFCYVLGDGRYIIGGPSNSGGIVIDWLYHDVLMGRATRGETPAQQDADFLAVMAAAEQAPLDDTLLCLPYVAGERAPLWDADARAVLFGLTLQHNAGSIMRAAIEGILFNAFWIASGLLGARHGPRQLVASGKVLEPEWIRRMTADIFGMPIRYRGAIDASAMGAATLAEVAAGNRGWDDAATRHAPVREDVIAPSGNDAYARKYARFRRLAELLLRDAPDLDAPQ